MKGPISLTSGDAEKLLLMAKALFKDYKVNFSYTNDCLDEFVTFTASKGNKTDLYHWFELAVIHIPPRIYSVRALKNLNLNLLEKINDDENIIELLWKDFKKLKK